ncbi:hypothetical protein [Ruegeria lacuscaerulensis]|uniref:hypothetical protein n=1 Tax=Ruegeria lacuscaerulensis TaxID=55218 RepID=UPI0014810096|nr:hypothetical protein [Ruegeria lacuscaerulensis]
MKNKKIKLEKESKCWDYNSLELLGLPSHQLPIGELQLPESVSISVAPRITERALVAEEKTLHRCSVAIDGT